MDYHLLDGMTGSAFLAHTRKLARYERFGGTLTERERAQIEHSLRIFGPEYFYMDGELFT